MRVFQLTPQSIQLLSLTSSIAGQAIFLILDLVVQAAPLLLVGLFLLLQLLLIYVTKKKKKKGNQQSVWVPMILADTMQLSDPISDTARKIQQNS